MKKKMSLTGLSITSFVTEKELIQAKGGESEGASQCINGGCYTYYWGPCLTSPGVACSYEYCD